jgi:uncharacterized membrane protein YedE/YeeE
MVLALLGGGLIGLSATLLWLWNGRVAGISGLLHDALWPSDTSRGERVAFLLGLVAAGVLLSGRSGVPSSGTPSLLVPVAGFLVGLGARLGGGCTSGHGVCGLSRFSVRSLAATLTFIVTGAITVFIATHALPGFGGAR